MKNTIIIIFTLIYLLLSILFITFQAFEIKNFQNQDIDFILEKIVVDLKNGDLKKETIKSLKPELFFVIWVKQNDKWVPLIYDREIDINIINNPLKIPSSIVYITRGYVKNIDNFQFLVWINRFATEYYIKNIFLPVLVIIFIYLFITFIINLIFYPIKGVNYIEEKEDVKEDLKEIEIKSDRNSEILEEYKILWVKNYKISEDFKNNFPFKRIYELIKFGINQESYLKECLRVASLYFKWENPTIYLRQKEHFIDIINKNILLEDNVEIPLKGDKKGDVFIPIYPFNQSNLFGYLYFQWHKLEDFFIADILYFLKYIFSEDTKMIFINQKEQQEIIETVNKFISKKGNEVAVILIAVDNREKFRAQLPVATFEILDSKIFNKIKEDYKKDYVFKIMPLYFMVISENIIKEKLIEFVEKWRTLPHIYTISSSEKDIATTFSIGIAFKSDRDIHPLTLINEAENNLKRARNNGGNQIII